MQETQSVQKKLNNREIDYLKIVAILFSRWYILLGMVLLGVLCAYLYLWHTPKTYATSGIIKFEEKRSEISDMINVMNNSGKTFSNLESERYILQSQSLLLSAIRKLDYRISFYSSGRIRTYDLYPNKPLKIDFLKFDTLDFYQDLITYKALDEQYFQLSWSRGDRENVKKFRYHTPVNIGKVSFTLKNPGNIPSNTVYLFRFNQPEQFLNRVRQGLRADEATKNSNVVTIQQTDSNPQFAADILNAMMDEYLNYDRDQKTKSATQMIRFISEQQQYLATQVKGAERSMEKQKQQSGVLDVSASSGVFLAKVTELESQRSLLKIQLIAIDQLHTQMTDKRSNVSLNFSMEGNIDPLLAALIANFNSLLSDRNVLLKTYSPSSQTVADLDRQIEQVKNAALQNIRASAQRIRKNMEYLDQQLSQANNQVSALPAAERDMVSLRRDFEISEKVYSFLSEKKLEAQINRSAIIPGATIIEHAQVNTHPVAPVAAEVYRGAILLGALGGIGIIILIRLSNPYIYDKEYVEHTTHQPIIGVINKFPDEIDEDSSQILALNKSRSVFAESVRAIRTNLNFLASEKNSKVICVTSEVSGEGKTFVAISLASTLSLIDKKVVVIGADLRRPKLHKTFGCSPDRGLSNYLINQCTVDEIIQRVENKNFDFISSGIIPPNPSELLNSERMSGLLQLLKERYEIIIIDTAPIGLVSDSIPLIRWSDINLFVIRYGRSTYHAASLPDRLSEEYHLTNMLVVLNAFEENRLYGGFYKKRGDHGTRYTDYSGYEKSGYYSNGK